MIPIKSKYQVLPDLSESEYGELKSDIAERGVMVPVEFDQDGNVLDGHHRLKICEELGITDYPKVIRAGLTESEKRYHARKLNMARRQMNQEQRRQLIQDQLKETPEKSDRQIADSLGVSPTTVGNARHDLEDSNQLSRLDSSVGADGKIRPRVVPKKPATFFNPSKKQEEEIKENLPAIIEKLDSGVAKDATQARIMAVDEKRHADEMARRDEVEQKNRELREFVSQPNNSNIFNLPKERVRRELEACDQAVVDAENISIFSKALSFPKIHAVTDDVLDSVVRAGFDLSSTVADISRVIDMLIAVKTKLLTRGGKTDGKTNRN